MTVLRYGDGAAREVSARIGGFVTTRTLLRGIAANDRADGQLWCVTGDPSLWVFQAASTAVASDDILVPTAGSGRYQRVGQAGGGGMVYAARGASTADIASLAAFTVAGVDGLTYVAGERILLKDQTTKSQNGIYVVGTVGGGTAPLTRAPDLDASTGEAVSGCIVSVSEGTAGANTLWTLTTNGAITLGSTSIDFGQYTAAAISSSAPINPTSGAAVVGNGATASPYNHRHQIVEATAANEGLATAAQITKLDAITALATATIKRTVTIGFAEMSGLGAGVKTYTKSLGAVLPSSARFVGLWCHTFTGFQDVGDTGAVTIEVGDAAGVATIVTATSVRTGATGFPKTGTAGALFAARAPLASGQATVKLTSAPDCKDLTAGAITVDLFYEVLA